MKCYEILGERSTPLEVGSVLRKFREVYSPFSDRVRLPLHNIPYSGVSMKSIGADVFHQLKEVEAGSFRPRPWGQGRVTEAR